MLRRSLGLREKKQQETGESYIMRSFIICVPCHILGDQVNEDEMGGQCGMYVDRRASNAVMIKAFE